LVIQRLTFGHFWSLRDSLLVTFGHFWSLRDSRLVTFGHSGTHVWSLLVTFGHFWSLRDSHMVTFGHSSDEDAQNAQLGGRDSRDLVGRAQLWVSATELALLLKAVDAFEAETASTTPAAGGDFF
jgi:hypothetical protein